MRAGTLKYKLQLLEPKRVTDRMGAERTEYVPTRVVRAERCLLYTSDAADEHIQV